MTSQQAGPGGHSPLTTHHSPGEERFRAFGEVVRFSLGENLSLAYSPLTRAVQRLPARDLALMQACRSFATLDEHALRLCRQPGHGPEQVAALRQELAALHAAGWLVARSDLVRSCLRQTSSATAAKIATIGIPTRDRPHGLERCLSSHLENAREHGRQPECVVIDDTSSSLTCDANRGMLQTQKSRFGGQLFYASPNEKAQFAAALATHAGVALEVVRFAMLNDERCPVATGGSRNALLLETAGKVALQADDDTIARLAPAAGSQPGLVCTSQFDPTEFWFPAAGDPLPADSAEGHDVLAIHEQLLGNGLGDCITAQGAGENLDLERAGAGFFRNLETTGGGVRLTALGVRGDSGMSSTLYFLTLEGPSRLRLLRSEAGYLHALAGHEIVRAVTNPTVGDGGFCMALHLGLDNRRLLPPFLPLGRNQDGVFGALVRCCFPGSYFGYLPWLIVHRRDVPRRFAREEVWGSAAGLQSGQMFQALVGSFAPGPDRANPAKNLRMLGQAFCEWGSAAPADFEEWLRLNLWNQVSRQVVQLETQLKSFAGQPAFWANDVTRVLAVWRQALASADYTVPRDLGDAFGVGEARTLFQRLVKKFGQLLQAWPDMMEAARDLHSRGVRLAVRM
jgi:hypothetical protein